MGKKLNRDPRWGERVIDREVDTGMVSDWPKHMEATRALGELLRREHPSLEHQVPTTLGADKPRF